MRSLFPVALLAAGAIARVHSISISEAAGFSTYTLCTGSEVYAYLTKFTAEGADCIGKTDGIGWDSVNLPTERQRQKLCSCKKLLQKLPTVPVPRCLIQVDRELSCPYVKVVAFSFDLCNSDGSPASGGAAELSCGEFTTAPPTTRSPIATTTRPPAVLTTAPPIRTSEAPDPDLPTKAPTRTTEAPDPYPVPTSEPIWTTSPGPTSKSPDNDIYTYGPVTYTPTPVENTSSNRTATVVGGSVGAAATVALTVTIVIRCRVHCAAKKNKTREIDGVVVEVESNDDRNERGDFHGISSRM